MDDLLLSEGSGMTWEINTASESDLPRISRRFKSLIPGNDTYGGVGQFYWKIFDNIFQKGMLFYISIDRAPVSTLSLTPKRIFLKNTPILAAELGDGYTAESFMRRGMYTDLANQTIEMGHKGGIEFIYGTTNAKALPALLKRTKFRSIENFVLSTLSLPLGVPRKISQWPWFIRDIGDYFVRIYAEVKLAINRPFFGGRKYAISKDIGLAKLAWREFWDEVRTSHDVLLDRSFEAVEWRFILSPTSYDMTFLWRDQRLVGYLVTRTLTASGESNLVVADCVCIPQESDGLRLLIRTIVKQALATRMTRISAWFVHGGTYYTEFLKMGFLSRDVVPVIGYFEGSSQRLDSLQNKWHFTISDSDNI